MHPNNRKRRGIKEKYNRKVVKWVDTKIKTLQKKRDKKEIRQWPAS